MEQIISFISTVVICTIAITNDMPGLFLATFVIGCLYHVIRGKQKGWKLPKDIRDTH